LFGHEKSFFTIKQEQNLPRRHKDTKEYMNDFAGSNLTPICVLVLCGRNVFYKISPPSSNDRIGLRTGVMIFPSAPNMMSALRMSVP
jgi:hypothetical protein